MISFSATPGVSLDGDGDKTTEGMRWCLDDDAGFGLGDREIERPLFAPGDTGAEGEDSMADDFVGSQSKPGLIIRLMVSPSLTMYSLSNLLSASAFPLRTRRKASAGGAEGWDASWALMEEIVSVG